MDRPLERRTSARTAVVWEAVQRLLERLDGPATVVDVGGGTGGVAVRLAGAGHRVTVVDPSPDALAALARRAAEHDDPTVADRVDGVQGDLADLAGLVPDATADLVLCHGVLGLLPGPAEQAAALGAIARVLRPGGTLSLVVAQRHAAVLARAMAGHFGQALAVLAGGDPESEHRFTADEIADLVGGAGFTVDEVQAVRVFADLVPGSLLDLEPGATAALLELERAVAGRPEYLALGAQLHLLATC